MPDSDLAPLPPRQAIPRHTTPTWEMELLISGATVFALMQLPALLDVALASLLPRFDRQVGTMILLPWMYVSSTVYALIITFVLHLATRGYWVALVGLASVYPEGVRWDALKWGPHYLATVRERMPPLPVLIERADNRASQVFGFGLGFALVVIAPLVLVTVTAGAAYGLSELLDRRWSWIAIWNVIIALIFAPYLVMIGIDRFWGRHLAPDGRAARVLRRGFAGYLRAGFSSFINFPVTMFVSLFGQNRGALLLSLVVLALVSLSMAKQFWHDFESRVGQFGPLAHAEVGQGRTLNPQHYADQRDPHDANAPLPFIPSEVVRGDYLRVFIPYRPTRDNRALEATCPEAMRPDAGEPDLALDCLASLYGIAIDGIRVADPAFDRAIDPRTRLRGVVAMLSVAHLARGRHELQVRQAEIAGPPDARAAPAHRIPFWR
jgi:hypothetical protein